MLMKGQEHMSHACGSLILSLLAAAKVSVYDAIFSNRVQHTVHFSDSTTHERS